MNFIKKNIALIVLAIISFVLIILLILSTGVDGETDSITHFQLARYAFKYPAFFLHHWGKPLFTILASPFSQFGYSGALVFNILCGLTSSWFAYLIARRLEFRFAWVAIVFTIFTPVYLLIMFTSLTEILFSLILIASIFLFIRKQFIWSAILISFIPFVRAEGMMYIILFIPPLLLLKQYKSLPFLFLGFIAFSIAGWPVYHDPLWFFTRMPYNNSGSALYGSGSFWYYFVNLETILNYPLIILGLTGLIYLLLNLRKAIKTPYDINQITIYLLILPSFFGFILAQSFLWWQGMMGVLASTRFIACVLPLSAIISLAGFEWIMQKANFNKVVLFSLGAFIIAIVAYKPFTYKQLPMKTGMNFAVMEKVAIWLKKSPFKERRAFYSDPMFPFYMDIDPFDASRCFKIYAYDNVDPASLLKPGELLIWDAQFTGYEGRLPFDSLMKNNNLRLLNVFTPDNSFSIIGGEKYKIAIFSKAPRDTSKVQYKQFFINEFEKNLSEQELKCISSQYSYSGKNSIELNPDNIYSPVATGKLSSIPGNGNGSLRASVRILNPLVDEKGQINLVVSIEGADHTVIKYNLAKDSEIKDKAGPWLTLSYTDMIDRNSPADGSYKVYVWYTGKGKVYIDDLKLEFMPVGYE